MTPTSWSILAFGSAVVIALAGLAFYGWQAGGLGLLQSGLPFCG